MTVPTPLDHDPATEVLIRGGRSRIAGLVTGALLPDVASRSAVLITSLVAARALDPAGFAEFLAWTAAALLASLAWDAGTGMLVQREVASGRAAPRDAALTAYRLRLVTIPVWSIAFGCGALLVYRLFDPSADTAMLFALTSIATGWRLIPVAVLQARLRFVHAGMAIAAGRWCTTMLAFASFSVASPSRLMALSFAVLLGECVALLISLFMASRHSAGIGGSERTNRRITLQNALPFAANTLMVQAYNRFDILVVAALTTAAQVGAYAPASRMQDALYVAPAAFGLVGLSLLSNARAGGSEDGRAQRLVAQLLAGGLLVAVPIAAVTCVFAPLIIRVILGDEYLESVVPVRIMSWSMVPAAFVAPLLAALAAADRAGDTTKVYGATLVTALVLHGALDWWAGATGAAVASLGRDVAAVVVAYALARRANLLPSVISLRRQRSSRKKTEAVVGR